MSFDLCRRNFHATENRNYAFYLKSKRCARVLRYTFCGMWLNAIRNWSICYALHSVWFNVFHFVKLSTIEYDNFALEWIRLFCMLITNTIVDPVLVFKFYSFSFCHNNYNVLLFEMNENWFMLYIFMSSFVWRWCFYYNFKTWY